MLWQTKNEGKKKDDLMAAFALSVGIKIIIKKYELYAKQPYNLLILF